MDVSKFKDNPHWMENYEHKPLKHSKIEKRPFWESNVVPAPWTKEQEGKTVGNWEEMMRKVTDERLRKWASSGLKGKLDERKNDSDGSNTVQKDSDESVFQSFENIDSEHTSTSSTEDFEKIEMTEKSMVEETLNKEEYLSEPMVPYRWGMSMNRPPDKIFKEILNNDIHKLQKKKKISQEKETNDDNDGNGEFSARFLSDKESDRSNERLNSKLARKRKHHSKHVHRAEIHDATTQLPIVEETTTTSGLQDIANSPNNTIESNEKNSNHDEIDDSAIKIAEDKSRIFSPILVLGPTFYVSNLPKTIKQKVKIHRPINLWNRIQTAHTTNNERIPTEKSNQSNDSDYSGVYEFY